MIRSNRPTPTTRYVLVAVCLLVIPGSASALYMVPELVDVPVERLTKNLSKTIAENPEDVEAQLNLARLHGLAYALATEKVKALKNDQKSGAWFGFEPRNVPYADRLKDPKNREPEAAKVAGEHLQKAIQQYETVLKLQPDHLKARLGYAWCLDQAGKVMQAITQYRQVIEVSWEKEKDMEVAPLGWHSITAEAAGYLIPHLDKERGAEEIETLKKRIKQVQSIPRPMTPIIVSLSHHQNVRQLIDLDAKVRFDADGTGLKKQWSWIRPETAWLVHDPRRTGKVTSALQWFGNVTFWLFWENGYHALSHLDNNDDGVLKGRELRGLSLWQDKNSNGISEPGEVRPLREWGIVELACSYESHQDHQHVKAWAKQGVTFADGRRLPTYDVILHPQGQ